MANFFEETENVDEELDDIIILHNNSTDRDEEFYHLATLDVDNKWYAVLQPAEELDDIEDGYVLIFEIVENAVNPEDVLIPVEDKIIQNKVLDAFNKELEKEDEQ